MRMRNDIETLQALWPDFTLCEVAEKLGRSKSWTWTTAEALGLPRKPRSARRKNAGRMEKGRAALKLRRSTNKSWQQIADELGLSSKGYAFTLAELAAGQPIAASRQAWRARG